MSDSPDRRSLQRVPSRETLPPAYDTQQHISRRTSLASISSAAPSSVFASTLSRSDTISPTSTNTSISQRTQRYNDWRAPSKSTVTSSFIPNPPKYDSWTSTTSSNVSLPRTASTQRSQEPIPNNKESSAWTPFEARFSQTPSASMPKFTPPKNKALQQHVPKLNLDHSHEYPSRKHQTTPGSIIPGRMIC
jgi:hypothetical protein